MNLTFTQNEQGQYESTFTATGDFNLHMESGVPIKAVVYQKSVSEGKYAVAAAFASKGNVMDEDFSALIYPKYIKVVSQYAVNNAVATIAE